jgi:7-carboxy-7-deazaguanine synthase (Cx14CxxC type)
VGPDGGKFSKPESLAAAVANAWRGGAESDERFVVCTGGEPLLQLDEPLIDAFHALGFRVAVETNGTKPAPRSLDWICVSPKAGAPLVQRSGHEIKLVFPQAAAMPEQFEAMQFENFFLQPMDGPSIEENTRLAVEYCMRNPQWRLSLQTHKLLGIR